MQQGHYSKKHIIRLRSDLEFCLIGATSGSTEDIKMTGLPGAASDRKLRIKNRSIAGTAGPVALASGFTLAELLVATLILSFALTQILILFMNCMASNEASRNLSTSVTHAEYVLEDVRNTDFSSIATGIANGTFNYADAAAVTAAGLQALKSETITAQSSGTNPLNVTVTVSWQDHGGRSRTKSLQTLIGG